jgi:hypothetical protein
MGHEAHNRSTLGSFTDLLVVRVVVEDRVVACKFGANGTPAVPSVLEPRLVQGQAPGRAIEAFARIRGGALTAARVAEHLDGQD